MARTIQLALTVALVAGLALAGTAVAQSEQRFADVPPDHYAHEAIDWMVDEGITGGCGDGSNFCPDDPLTRAHIAAFLYRYHQRFDGPAADTAPTAADCDASIDAWLVDKAEIEVWLNLLELALGLGQVGPAREYYTEAKALIERWLPTGRAILADCSVDDHAGLQATVDAIDAGWDDFRRICREDLNWGSIC